MLAERCRNLVEVKVGAEKALAKLGLVTLHEEMVPHARQRVENPALVHAVCGRV